MLTITVLTSCSRKTDAQIPDKNHHDNIILGFSQIGAESAWRTYNTKSMQDAAAKAGIQLLYANAEQKQENQIKAIRSFIVYQVDVIAFVPIVQDGWDNVLKEAKDAHIPVIICDRKITGM
jgi:galactofuranose transport system substrate-binding protein